MAGYSIQSKRRNKRITLTGMRVERRNTREEVSRQVVPARRGGRVHPVRGDHVVDARLVDRVVGDANDSGEDQRRDPVHIVLWPQGCPGESH